MSKDMDYDIAVIGGGPGGYVAAIKAAQLGFKTACIDKRGVFGGTCLLEGCIPSKAMLHASYEYYKLQHKLPDFGIKAKGAELDLKKFMAHKDNVVKGLTDGISHLFKKNKVTPITGAATFKDKNTLEIKEEKGKTKTLTAKYIIIATGSTSASIPGVDINENRIVSSTGALSLPEVPKHLVVIGGGYIGLELGSVWARLGSKVTVVEMAESIVPGMDKDIQKGLFKSLKNQGLDIRTHTKTEKVAATKNGVTLALSSDGDKEDLKADYVLIATGRKPFTDKLGLENVGIKLDEKGFVVVNENLQTTIDNIYAIGDVVPGPMLAHKAEEEGVLVAETLAGQKPKIHYDLIPSVIYTHPEAASVGKTEEELEEGTYNVGMFPMMANSRARAINESDGFVKILTDKTTDTILGVHILSDQAGTMIAEVVAALEFGATAEDIARTCHAHPTHSEAVKEAAMAAWQKAIHY